MIWAPKKLHNQKTSKLSWQKKNRAGYSKYFVVLSFPPRHPRHRGYETGDCSGATFASEIHEGLRTFEPGLLDGAVQENDLAA